MTNRPEMSVNMSMNARGSSGSVGRPGFGSSVTRTGPHRWKSAVREVRARRDHTIVIDARNDAREHVRWESRRVEQVVPEQLAGLVCLAEDRERQVRMWPPGQFH